MYVRDVFQSSHLRLILATFSYRGNPLFYLLFQSSHLRLILATIISEFVNRSR